MEGVFKMEGYDLTLWEICENCYTGGYISGDSFESEEGNILYFDGVSLNCKYKLNVNEKFKYLGDI